MPRATYMFRKRVKLSRKCVCACWWACVHACVCCMRACIHACVQDGRGAWKSPAASVWPRKERSHSMRGAYRREKARGAPAAVPSNASNAATCSAGVASRTRACSNTPVSRRSGGKFQRRAQVQFEIQDGTLAAQPTCQVRPVRICQKQERLLCTHLCEVCIDSGICGRSHMAVAKQGRTCIGNKILFVIAAAVATAFGRCLGCLDEFEKRQKCTLRHYASSCQGLGPASEVCA